MYHHLETNKKSCSDASKRISTLIRPSLVATDSLLVPRNALTKKRKMPEPEISGRAFNPTQPYTYVDLMTNVKTIASNLILICRLNKTGLDGCIWT